MDKILMSTPIVEIQGDEMTRLLWDWIKEILIEPFVKLNTEFYDLGLMNRDDSDDQVTFEAAAAIKKWGIGVKCATITPNAQRMDEYKLKRLYPSPNATIRAELDGTVFRAPITAEGINPFIPSWTKPITIARHAYGDVYKNIEHYVKAPAKAELVISSADGKTEKTIFEFKGDGIVQGMHNTAASISSFARAVFNYALDTKQPVWFGTKDTISKIYDHAFKDIFEEIFNSEFKAAFESAGLYYDYSLIDDSVARVIRSSGGFVWALKNYDGDVMSDMVATVFGSLAMMSSVLVSPDGKYEFEAAHGTVTRHYHKHLAGGVTSTNPIATIFAWTGALKKRGQLDGNGALAEFAAKLERASLKTIESGYMTGDLIALFQKEGVTPKKLETKEFLYAIASNLS